jgi:membrane-associated phospholipid phosphatase
MTTNNLPLCPDWRLWAVCGVLALVDAVWLSLSRLTVDEFTWFLWASIGAVCLAWYGAGYFIRLSDGPRLLTAGLAFVWLGWKLVAILDQLTMTLAAPLADSRLAGWDQALGFDWLDYLSWVAARPWLSTALGWIYGALTPVSVLAFLVLHVAGRRERVSEYLALSFGSGLIVAIIGAGFPAIGAVTYHQAPAALMAAFPADAGAQWVERLTALRSGGPVDISHNVGLVSFPSYHTALALIIAWCFREFRFIFPIGIIYAAGTAAGALIIGGHYFVDLLAGAMLVCALVAAGRYGRTLRWRLPQIRRSAYPE